MKRQENETLADFVLRFMDAWCPRSTAKPHEIVVQRPNLDECNCETCREYRNGDLPEVR